MSGWFVVINTTQSLSDISKENHGLSQITVGKTSKKANILNKTFLPVLFALIKLAAKQLQYLFRVDRGGYQVLHTQSHDVVFFWSNH